MSAHHDHHGHGHHHGPANYDRAFAVGIGLNVAYVVAEAGAGLWTGSVALLADAGHNLSDVLGLAVAWGGAALARRPATGRYTYGWKGATILAALANSLLLLVALGAVMLEAARRLAEPAPVMGGVVAGVAAVGILVPQVLWCLDFGAELLGLRLVGLTGYMFDANRSLFLRGLSFFHGWLPFLLLFLVKRLGYDRRNGLKHVLA